MALAIIKQPLAGVRSEPCAFLWSCSKSVNRLRTHRGHAPELTAANQEASSEERLEEKLDETPQQVTEPGTALVDVDQSADDTGEGEKRKKRDKKRKRSREKQMKVESPVECPVVCVDDDDIGDGKLFPSVYAKQVFLEQEATRVMNESNKDSEEETPKKRRSGETEEEGSPIKEEIGFSQIIENAKAADAGIKTHKGEPPKPAPRVKRVEPRRTPHVPKAAPPTQTPATTKTAGLSKRSIVSLKKRVSEKSPQTSTFSFEAPKKEFSEKDRSWWPAKPLEVYWGVPCPTGTKQAPKNIKRCPYCDAISDSPSTLTAHMRAMHQEELKEDLPIGAMRRLYNLCAEGIRVVSEDRVWRHFTQFECDGETTLKMKKALKLALAEGLVRTGDEKGPPFGGEALFKEEISALTADYEDEEEEEFDDVKPKEPPQAPLRRSSKPSSSSSSSDEESS